MNTKKHPHVFWKEKNKKGGFDKQKTGFYEYT